MSKVYVLNFYYSEGYDSGEYFLYFSSLEKVDEFMDKWEKGVAEVEDKGVERLLAHCYDALVYELPIDTMVIPKILYRFRRTSDNPDDYYAEYHWHKVMPKEKTNE